MTNFKLQITNKISNTKSQKNWAFRIGQWVFIGFWILGIGVSGFAPAALAQSGLGISIAPALNQLTLKPGETWSSELKITNPNTHELKLYTTPMNFEAGNEHGRPQFTPIVEEDLGNDSGPTLAHWINITDEPTIVPPEASASVPFSVNVPEDAPPGGHYAAIMIGTRPPVENDGPKTVVSSMVSSLFVLKVHGDVVEQGMIREFSMPSTWVQKPESKFTLRFQNDGNVHLRPKGEVKIYNMWGKERGTVDINHTNGFGNVLPGTVRDFGFEWRGESNIFDIGRYRAEATLTFGEDMRQSADSAIYFWIIPLKTTLGVLGGFISTILLIVFSIRWYVRRAFKLQAERFGFEPGNIKTESKKEKKQKRKKEIVHKKEKRKYSGFRFFTLLFKKYWKEFTVASLIILGIAFSALFLKENLTQERSFEITVEQEQGNDILK